MSLRVFFMGRSTTIHFAILECGMLPIYIGIVKIGVLEEDWSLHDISI
jgi:hypothetical protein